jgi:hypothetical protein
MDEEKSQKSYTSIASSQVKIWTGDTPDTGY